MPVTLQPNIIKFKSTTDDNFIGINAITDISTETQLANIEAAGTTALTNLDTRFNQILDALDQIQDTITNTQQTIEGEGYTYFNPTTNTPITTSINCTFTGRNLLPIYDALGEKYPTLDNTIAYRYIWGSEYAPMITLLNQLPAGRYSLTIGYQLTEANSNYNGTSAQTTWISMFIGETQLDSSTVTCTNNNTGDTVESHITFDLTEETAGTIAHCYLYIGNSGTGTKTKWNVHLAYAQIESGNKTTHQQYNSTSGTEIIAYDSKMSAFSSQGYTLTYQSANSSSSSDSGSGSSETDTQTENISLPDYFQTEVDDCVSKLENYCTNKSLVYMIVTDTHVHVETSHITKNRWKATVKNMKAVNAAYQADGLIHLGDMINGTLPSETSKGIIRMIRDDMRSIIEPNFILVGNHDTNTIYGSNMEAALTEAEMYALWGRHNEKIVQGRPGNVPYCYKDYDSLGLRVLYLSSSMGDYTHGTDGGNWGFPLAERDWLENEALNTNYQVLMFSHMPMSQGYISRSSALPYNGPSMIETVANFQSHGGIVVGLINGHTHFDYVHDNGHFKEIAVASQKFLGNTEDASGTAVYPFCPPEGVAPGRTDNTVTQDLWNILVVKPIERECKIIRFGAGNDVTWTY